MVRPHPRSTRTDPFLPYATLVRSARLDLADVLRQDEPVSARRHAEQAAAELATMGLVEWAAVARSLVEELHLAGHGAPIARRDGPQWSLRHPSGAATVPDSKRVRHLVALLCRPGEALGRSEEHTSELQSLMRTSYAVLRLN